MSELKPVITLQGKINLDDCYKAMYLSMRPSRLSKYLIGFLLGLCLVALGVSLHLNSLFNTSLLNLAPLLYFFVLIAIIFYFNYQRLRKSFSEMSKFIVESEIVISSETITSTSEFGTFSNPLSYFQKYKIGKNLVLLYMSSTSYYIFPRRFFESEEDFNIFLSYLKANLGNPMN